MAGPFSPAPGPAGGNSVVPALTQGPPGVVNTVIAQQIIQQLQAIADNLKAAFSSQASGDLSGIFPGPIQVIATHLAAPLALLQGGTGNTTGQPSGAAVGDLSGTYPAPSVEALNGHSITPAVWTPSDGSGAALVFTGVNAKATRHDNMMFAYASLTYPNTADASHAIIAGLPVAVPNQSYAQGPCMVFCSGAATGVMLVPIINSTTAKVVNPIGGAALTNANLSTLTLDFLLIYPLA